MLDFGLIVMLGTWFLGFTLLNRIMEGAMITSTDISILNQITITRTVDVGLFSIPVPNTSIISGLYHLVQWDYDFFGGNAQIIQFFLYTISFAVAVILFLSILGLLYNYFSRSR